MMQRHDQRFAHQCRPIELIPNFTQHAEGSVLACFGQTKVLCTASLEEGVPHFIRHSGQGWVTAEYSMLPRATHQRSTREVSRGKPSGRTSEIQRLIGRSLRSAIDLSAMNGYTLTLDCDVLQADGGTRTTAISGAMLACHLAFSRAVANQLLAQHPCPLWVAAVSVGIVNGQVVCDLDYQEDSQAQTDMNVVMDEQGRYIEIQGTAEKHPFTSSELQDMLALAQQGISAIIEQQKACALELCT